jgi:indolepyruvate ferredoxin oxidoreductase, beta subunit
MAMASNGVTNVVFAGLGGQGVIKASDILADAACRCGFDVKKAEIHGMSQRGGSVTSDVRFGKQVYSPMVPAGEADYLIVLAPDQVENNRHMLRPGGVLIPCTLIDESKLASKRSLNIALLGVLSVHLKGVPRETWIDAVKAALPAKVHETNEKAFQFGAESATAAGT